MKTHPSHSVSLVNAYGKKVFHTLITQKPPNKISYDDYNMIVCKFGNETKIKRKRERKRKQQHTKRQNK